LAIVTQHIEFLYGIIKDSYSFSSNFNKQLELRSSLWKEGFISEMKELPGLLRQERESLKCLILVEYYRYQLAQNGQ
jgi:brefeldin A-inhibited guanine nucleotide-exchange protein